MRPSGPFWTVPNVLSLSRIVLLPVFIWALITPGHLVLAFALVVYAIASDLLDGYLARLLQQESEWGKILDPLADKLAVAAGLIYCTAERGLPLWIVSLILSRDLLIAIGLPFVSRHRGEVPASNLTGRLAALSFALLVVVYFLNLEAAKLPALAAATVLLFLSSVTYARRCFARAR